jgi:hypothetical protein
LVGLRKLREASFFLQRCRETEGGETEIAGYFLSAFLSAGRSVANALEKRRTRGYRSWRLTCTEAQRRLLNFMTAQRDDEIHEVGAIRGVTVVVPSILANRTTRVVSVSSTATSFITFDYDGKVEAAIPMCEAYLSLLGEALDAGCPEVISGAGRAVEQGDEADEA